MRRFLVLETERDPEELIREIGERPFHVCDERWERGYRHALHPKVIRIMSKDIRIEVHGNRAREVSKALSELLNQSYNVVRGVGDGNEV